MGLDNGIRIYVTHKAEIVANMPETIAEIVDANRWDTDEIEICYWRKCWNIRSAIIHVSEQGINYNGEGGGFDLTEDDLYSIRGELMEFLMNGEDAWNSEPLNSSIWSFKEIRHHLADDIVAISWALDLMERGWVKRCEFYDSY